MTIGRIMIASTTPAKKIVPLALTPASANSGNQPNAFENACLDGG